ncbi:MAG: hypothetical protein ACR2PH_03590 [Desulfobulbia bacterium]
MKTYKFHSDPSHGWLAVKRKELIDLGIYGQFSMCSYEKGQTVYLEEDCDAPIFLKALKDAGIPFEIKESFQEKSPIRYYDRFIGNFTL